MMSIWWMRDDSEWVNSHEASEASQESLNITFFKYSLLPLSFIKYIYSCKVCVYMCVLLFVSRSSRECCISSRTHGILIYDCHPSLLYRTHLYLWWKVGTRWSTCRPAAPASPISVIQVTCSNSFFLFHFSPILFTLLIFLSFPLKAAVIIVHLNNRSINWQLLTGDSKGNRLFNLMEDCFLT